jgi:membrane associated rhomboid family serine protease
MSKLHWSDFAWLIVAVVFLIGLIRATILNRKFVAAAAKESLAEEENVPLSSQGQESGLPPATAFLITSGMVFLVTLVSCLYWNDIAGSKRFLACSRSDVIEHFQVWRLFTAPLIHRDLAHLVNNLLGFSLVGFLLATEQGIWAFPILPFAVIPIVQFLQLLSYRHDIQTLGLSGLVFFLIGFWLVHFYFLRTRFPKFVRAAASLIILLFAFFSAPAEPDIAYRAHVIGAVFGFTCATFFLARARFISPPVAQNLAKNL